MMVTKNQWIVVGLLLCLNNHDTIAFSLSTATKHPSIQCVEQQRKTELSATLDSKPIEEDAAQKKPRRVRYAGKYPRNFKDKYKEHAGDDATISKVLAKGMTPAGTHVPIMLKECLQHMGLLGKEKKDDEPLLVVDCTLGYGGHSSHILRALKQQQQQVPNMHNSELIAFDQDSLEIAKTEARLREELLSPDGDDDDCHSVQLTAVNQNFCTLKSHLESTGQVGKVTSLLADLGLSSMQIDDNDRGFTYKREGPLDMRMNNNEGETAYELLCRLKPKQLKRMLQENSDEVYATEIAFGLLHNKKHTIPETTIELATRVREIVEPLLLEATNKPKKVEKKQLDSTVARVMQALRIELNGEFLVLEQLLQDLPSVLAPGGRAVFLTFHSGEDRRVKKAFKAGFKSGIYSSWSRHVDRPTAAERRNNPRSSCCKLRWAIRSEDVHVVE
ncbi:small subunit methyltransferase H [Seminavis robusta]|uniref:Small subunit methyltransferase H n=1 Tax=Seminavis robusta TaxID=568900 RepID=A0A9N8HIZ0_9STRA|nr:small subunit methyltransferase H [Seminavis robusta]|eukprot:Sro526_g160330.1 small subunit methyltransferase H (445) ;mRNA; f:15865-17199